MDTTTSLKNLVQDARQLTSHILPTSLTPVERGLDQIEASTKRLLRRTTTSAGRVANSDRQEDFDNRSPINMSLLPVPAADSRTAYLLASRGMDSDRVLQSLADINLALSFEPLQAIPDTDIEAYLRHEHETLVSLAVQETMSRTISDFESHFEASFQKSWSREKRKIMENMGHRTMTIDDTVMGDVGGAEAGPYGGIPRYPGSGGISGNKRLNSYVSVVKDMNIARLNLGRFNAGLSFLKASTKSSTDSSHQFITNCWGLFLKMLNIEKDNAGQLEASHFSRIFNQLLPNPNNAESIKFRSKLVEGGRSWLESSFEDWLSQHVRDQHSEIGGKPSIHTIVDAYLKIKFFRNGRWSLSWLDQSIGKSPFWAHLFVLIRMGKVKEGAEYVEKHSAELSASKDANFIKYFKEWAFSSDRRLSKKSRDLLIGDWTSRIRDILINPKSPKGDVFKYTIYKIIGRCEMNVKSIRNTDVIGITEDYLWIHFMLISEAHDSSEPSFEKYNLSDFSTAMQKFGKSHFKKTDTWFMVLLLCGEFEKAVSELSLETAYAGDAVHFACAMAYYGVLRVPESPKSIPLSNSLLSVSRVKVNNVDYDVYSLHFARMVSQFVKEWVSTDPTDAFHYIYLVGLYGNSLDSSAPHGVSQKTWDDGKEYTRFIYTLIKDTLTQLGEATRLLGQMRPDGRGRSAGSIEKFRSLIHLASEQDFLDRIVLATAEQCDHEARFKEALTLYHLAGQPNKVLELLIRQISEMLLSRSVGQSIKSSSNEEDPVETATNVMEFYQSRQQESSLMDPKIAYTCRTLVTLANFGTLVGQGQLEKAVEKFYSLDLVATTNDMNLIQKKAVAFSSLSESVCRVIPSTLVQVVTCLSHMYRQISQGRYSERESRLRDIKTRTKAILSFCGLIQYQIPQDMFAQMNRLDVMMS